MGVQNFVVSWIPDVLDGALSLAEGDFKGAGLSLLGALPFLGLAANGTKIARATDKLTDLLKRTGCACFIAGTLVVTSVGARPIETLRIGDTVLARDEVTGETAYKPITEIYVNDQGSVWELTIVDATGKTDVHQVTANHPYWIEGQGWVAVEDLIVGTNLTTENGMTAVLVGKRDTGHVERTYNLEVADFHTYFVGPQRVLVHNGGPCNKLQPDPAAVGPHTSFKRGQDGKVSGYETYKASDPRNPNPWTSEKRVDVTGAPHYNKDTGQYVPTPHAQGRDIPGGVRPAEPWEIPR